ncbi:MAG TPA: hypothetical protein VFP94_00340 [Terriglobales bacterium]|nr:hypothetical protein [Terriglobales bacterium]
METFNCPYCQSIITGVSPAAHAFVFNVAVRQVVEDAKALRAGDVLVVVDSTIHPEDHAIHRCDDPQGVQVVKWFQHHATEAYSAINSAIRRSIDAQAEVHS